MRIALALFALAACLVATGCLESSDDISINADGSGTISSTYVVDTKKAAELIDFAKMFGPPAEEAEEELPQPDPFAEVWFRKGAEGVDGYEILDVTRSVSGDSQSTTVKSKFKSIEAAARSGAFFTSTVTLEQVDAEADVESEDKKDGDGAATEGAEKKHTKLWKLTMRDAVAEDMGGMKPKDVLPMVQAQLATLSIKRSVTPPSPIVKTNGQKSEDGKSVSWTIDYDAVLEGGDLEMTVYFECRDDVKLEAFVHSPELMAMLPRLMEPAPEVKAKPVVTGDKPADGEKSGAGDMPGGGDDGK